MRKEAKPLDDCGGAKELAAYRLSVAKEDLADAEHSFGEKRYRNANNRAYYAIFRAISACLALEFRSFKTHAQVIGHFNKGYVAIHQQYSMAKRKDEIDFFYSL